MVRLRGKKGVFGGIALAIGIATLAYAMDADIFVHDGTKSYHAYGDSSGYQHIKISDGTETANVNASNQLEVEVKNTSLTVSATDLDIRDLTATDVVTVTGGVGQTADVKITLDSEAVSLNALPAGSNNIGDVDVASIAAGDNNIGNVDVVTLPAIPAGTNIIGKVGIDQTTPGTTNGVQVNAALPAGNNNIGDVDIASALPAGTNVIGAVKNDGVNYTPIYKQANYSAAQTDAIVWDPAVGKKVVITDIILSAEGACNIFIEDGTTTVIIPKMYFGANGGMAMPLQTPIKCTTDNNVTITSSAAVNHSIFLAGYEE